ncbi:hypothetical protein K227x_59120 [Rubripirellula lacrimiformis]|uniref:Uncharacterized protein n=1 Tax=Rubripirellula lacrimiformis TaxID=1930273 RepID=A0A517NK24_9BACT|nr:hypothetical protein K227x_59120 [Rubripirellula lacrimiformis]
MDFLLAAAAESNGDGSFLGFLILGGIIWFVVWLCSSKPKSYEFNSRTTGNIRQR